MTAIESQLVDPNAGIGTSLAIVTVVVPVRNEEAFIAETLDQLLDQQLDGIALEILVVDGQSTDQTRAIVTKYADANTCIRLLDNPRRLSSAARNIAIRNMSGDYLVVIDGHCEIPSRQYFVDLVEAFRESDADCLGRPQPLNVTDATPLQRAIATARSSRLGHHPESFIYADEPQFVPAKSVAVAYRREVFEKVGLFDEEFDAHEDGEFNYRCDQAGLRCYFTPKIAVRYYPRNSLAGLFKQMYRYGKGRVRVARKHPETWGIGFLVPAALVVYLLVGGLVSAFSSTVALGFAGGLALYLAALCASGLAVALSRCRRATAVRVPLVLAVVHMGAGCGVLSELAQGWALAAVRPFTNSNSSNGRRK